VIGAMTTQHELLASPEIATSLPILRETALLIADPQVRYRGMIVEHGGTLTLGTPVKLSDTPASLRTAPAKFGEHTESVLAGLGYRAEEIARLRRDGVV